MENDLPKSVDIVSTGNRILSCAFLSSKLFPLRCTGILGVWTGHKLEWFDKDIGAIGCREEIVTVF